MEIVLFDVWCVLFDKEGNLVGYEVVCVVCDEGVCVDMMVEWFVGLKLLWSGGKFVE